MLRRQFLKWMTGTAAAAAVVPLLSPLEVLAEPVAAPIAPLQVTPPALWELELRAYQQNWGAWAPFKMPIHPLTAEELEGYRDERPPFDMEALRLEERRRWEEERRQWAEVIVPQTRRTVRMTHNYRSFRKGEIVNGDHDTTAELLRLGVAVPV